MAGGRRRILVIEDDSETAEHLVESLATKGYQVDLAVNGDDELSRGRSAEYAVMAIDRMLPGMDGIAIIRRLREDGIVTPALIISALGEIDDRVRGLRAGGDDYLVKPFAFAELLARVEALAPERYRGELGRRWDLIPMPPSASKSRGRFQRG
jgi:two-component system, OmpR family, response regulator